MYKRQAMVGLEPTTHGLRIEVTLFLRHSNLIFNQPELAELAGLEVSILKKLICLAVYLRIELISLGRQPGRITITPIDHFV